MGWRDWLFGRTAKRCAYCGAPVANGEGFRVLPVQIYCNEAHAVEDQQNPAI